MVPVLSVGLFLTIHIAECKILVHQSDDGREYTWREAYNKCKSLNGHLAPQSASLNTIDKEKLEEGKAWVGEVVLLSKWLKIIGCYLMPHVETELLQIKTVAACERECRKYSYFASDALTNRDGMSCICLNILTMSYDASYCFDRNRLTYKTVYSRYNQTVPNENGEGNCMVNHFIPNSPLTQPSVTSCNNYDSGTHGVCDGCHLVPSWNSNWNESLMYCINQHKVYFVDNFSINCDGLLARSWTRYFRQTFSVTLQNTDYIDSIPEKCGEIQYESTKTVFAFTRCQEKLSYFVCEIDIPDFISTTDISKSSTEWNGTKQWNTPDGTKFRTSIHKNTTRRSDMSARIHKEKTFKPKIKQYTTEKSAVSTGNTFMTWPTKFTEVVNKMQSNDSDDAQISITGIVIGVIVGVLLVALTIGILLWIYKKRNRMASVKRQFPNDAYNDTFEPTNATHETPGLQLSVGDSVGTVNQEYAVVQKTKRNRDVNLPKAEETYNESSNDDYDHLNEIDKRRIRLSENTYESNVGLRNISDPTYDTSQSTTRMIDNHNDVYDHFSQTSVLGSDDTYSVSYSAKINNKNDIYD